MDPVTMDDEVEGLIIFEVACEELLEHVESVPQLWYAEYMSLQAEHPRSGPSPVEPSFIRRFLYNVADVLLNVLVIVGIVAVVRTFIVSPFEVEGSSMAPTLEDNQYIIINKFQYLLGELFGREGFKPGRGDVVVFRPPAEGRKYYVKRIIGIPGDEILLRDGHVYLVQEEEEVPLEEEYLDERNRGQTFRAPVGSGDRSEERHIVPDGHYFLLGDNRQGSLDSRSFRNAQGEVTPFVARRNIAGRVWFVALPITKSHALQTPEYGL
jgi:signal peptidase I